MRFSARRLTAHGLAFTSLVSLAMALSLACAIPAAAQRSPTVFDTINGPELLSPNSRSRRILVRGPHQRPVRLYTETLGSGRRTIVLLHGLGASSYAWRRVARRIGKRHRVVAIDLKGHGRSDKPFDAAYAPTAHAELVRDGLRQMGLRNVTLVGHSFGGLVALVAALQERDLHSKRISRLVLVSAPALPQKASLMVRFLQKPVLPYIALSLVPPQVQVALALMSEAVGMGHITQTDVDFYAQPLFDPGGQHALIQTARQIHLPDADRFVRGYRSVRLPTLILHCRGDQVVPLSTPQRLSQIMPRARLQLLDRCDHVPPEQRPRLTARLISRFAR